VGISRDCPNFWVPPIISGTGKATDFKFCRNIHSVDRNKSRWKMLGIIAVSVVRESQTFSGHPCIGRIARSSLRYHSFLVEQWNWTIIQQRYVTTCTRTEPRERTRKWKIIIGFAAETLHANRSKWPDRASDQNCWLRSTKQLLSRWSVSMDQSAAGDEDGIIDTRTVLKPAENRDVPTQLIHVSPTVIISILL